MPLSNQQSTYQYVVGSLGQSLPFPNTYWFTGDLTVIDRNPTTHAETVLSYGTDYTLTNVGVAGGGNVVMEPTGLHYAVGDEISISRSTVTTQPTNYVDSVTFPAATDNFGLDWIVA